MLNKQISLAQRSGKVKTTRELVENLGIEPSAAVSRQSSLSPPPMTSLVPSENKDELMKRFFESQRHGDTVIPTAEQPASRPGSATAAAGGLVTSSSATVSQASSRAPTPKGLTGTSAAGTTVEDILAQLPPIDPEAVLAEWSSQIEEEEEIEGLIPVYRPPGLEVTDQIVASLNSDTGDRIEHVGGITDHTGVFREWHEMVAVARKAAAEDEASGDLMHILPYTVIE
jgi:hypothetical protein